MVALPGIFALLVAAAGWFYLFYSRAATNLSGLEESHDNWLRIMLRRVGGIVMILLAISFYAGSVAIDQERTVLAAVCMAAVFVLLAAIIVLGLLDIRLTAKLRKAKQRQDSQ